MGTAYSSIVKLIHLMLRLFFRRVEVTGLEHIPKDGGGIVVSWHPNGMIDPALIFESFPRPIVFGARHGLLKVPVLGWMMRSVGTVPIFRASDMLGQDPDARRKANKKSLDALAAKVVEGNFSCLFPEGDSHDSPFLLELKTGVARFYYRARQLMPEGAPPPTIIPVGLHYDHKRSFRSNVLVAFHPPLTIPEELDLTPPEGEERDTARARYRALTDEVEHALIESVHATDSWEIHFLMHRARKLVRAERACRSEATLDAPSMTERVRGFARIWSGYYSRLETHTDETMALRDKVAAYDHDLRALGMQDHELDRGPPIMRAWLGLLLILQAILVYALMPPILIVGAIINGPAALLLLLISNLTSKKRKDEATVKLMVGSLLFPATWVGAGLLVGWGHSLAHEMYPAVPDNFVAAGLLTALLAIVGGAISLRYMRLSRETARAVRVRLTRERRRVAVARLKLDRSDLYEALIGLAEGLELPHAVEADGRVGPSTG